MESIIRYSQRILMLFAGLVGSGKTSQAGLLRVKTQSLVYITGKPCIYPSPVLILVAGNSAQWLGLCHLISKNR